MSTVRLSGLGILLASFLALAACGGKKKPITPDETASTDGGGTDLPAAEDAGTDMAMNGGADGGGTSTPTPEKKPPPALALPAASAKITIKKKAVEVKSDGSVSIAGKPAGKLAGADMQDADGKTALSVAADGSVTTGDGTNVGSFTGDDLTLTTGEKYSLQDDGNLQVTPSGDKKAAIWGKATGVGTAKKAIVLASYVAGKAEAAPAKPATPPKKTPPKKK